MTIAAKHLDPLVGLDTHILLIPTPAGPVPTPIPHPYVGIVFDAMDYIPKFGATTYINGLPRGQAGSSGQATPVHIPMGAPFAKPPTNESEIFMGSAKVEVDGEPQGLLGMPVLSCQDIGMVAPPRAKKKTKAKSLELPTTSLLSIPMGSLVLIGGPPIISLGGMAQKIGLAALKKIAKLGPIARRIKALSDKLHKAAEKLMKKLGLGDAARNLVHKAVCTVTGHPVDVATGKVFTDGVDVELPGFLPLLWERTWFSTSTYRGPLGHGWHHSYDQALIVTDEVVLYRAADGRHIPLAPLPPGGEYFNVQERLSYARPGGRHVVRDSAGISYHFESVGRANAELGLTLIENPAGQGLRLVYKSGLLVEIVDSAGRSIELSVDSLGRIGSITLPHPTIPGQRVTAARYVYDAQGDLVAFVDALGAKLEFSYQSHLLVREKQRDGMTFYFEYDGEDETARCTHTWGDGGLYDHRLSYDLDANITLVKNSLGHEKKFFLREGTPWKVIDARGGIHLTDRDDNNQVVKETDPVGATSSYAYDARGNLLKQTAPDGAVTLFSYDGRDLPVRGVDPVGSTWSWEYDEYRRLIARVDPLGRRTTYSWSRAHLGRVINAAGQVISLDFDAAGNLISLRLPDGARCHWAFDALGRCERQIDPKGNVEQYTFDLLGRVVRVLEPDGNQRDIAYNPEGEVVHVTDRQYDVAFEFDRPGCRVVRIQAGTRVEFRYDTEEQLIAICNEHGSVFRLQRNAVGDVEAEFEFDGLRRGYVRDLAGRTVMIERAGGHKSKLVHDAMGRVRSILHSDGTSEAYRYSKDGLLAEARNETCVVKFERDAAGNVLRESRDAHWVSSEYDLVDRRVRVRSSKGLQLELQHNAMGDALRMRAATDPATADLPQPPALPADTAEVSFVRDELGQELERQLPGRVRSRWERDQLGRPVRHEIWQGAAPLKARQYSWEVNDRLQLIIDSLRGPVRFGYDAAGSLTRAIDAGGKIDLRLPDAIGNLFRTHEGTDRVYGPAGQLLELRTALGVTHYEYDPEGNLQRKLEPNGDAWSYEWNVAGRLLAVVRPDGARVQFGYDALGRRVWKEYKGKKTHWIWDRNLPLHEWVELTPAARPAPAAAQQADVARAKQRQAALQPSPPRGPPPAASHAAAPPVHEGTADNPITWLFDPSTSAPVARLVGSHSYGIVVDHLGTPCAMFDQRGQQVFAADIDIYGNLVDLQGSRQACPFRWPGQYEDGETGLYYNWQRYYDPEAGSYISRDPIGLDGGLASYAYVKNPNSYSDFFGTIAGGSYRKVRDSRRGGEVHHMPADSISPLSTDSGPSIWMSKSDHKRTASHGSRDAAKEWRQDTEQMLKKGDWSGTLGKEMSDIKKKFGNKYNKGMGEMLDYALEADKISKKDHARLKRRCKG